MLQIGTVNDHFNYLHFPGFTVIFMILKVLRFNFLIYISLNVFIAAYHSAIV